MNTKGFYLLCFLMGVTITLLMAVLHHNVVPPAQASTAGQGNQSFAVGTGMVDSDGQGVLWIIDPEKKIIACYANDRGVGIRMIGTRKIEFDMKMIELNDLTKPEAFKAAKLKKQHSRNKGGK